MTKDLSSAALTNNSSSPSLLYRKINENAILPRQAYDAAVGFDLAACLISESGRSQQIVLSPRCVRMIPTGLILRASSNFFVAICSRSGLASKNPPIFVANAPGIIDPDYTGEARILLYNGGNESVYVKHGDFIAQAILLPYTAGRLNELKSLPTTNRGDKGYGSSDEAKKV